MTGIKEQIEHIHSKIEQARSKNDQLVGSVQFVAAIAQETAAGVEEVNSTSIQQDASIRRIAEESDDILALADRLFAEISKFQITETDEEVADGHNNTATDHTSDDKGTEGSSDNDGDGHSNEQVVAELTVTQVNETAISHHADHVRDVEAGTKTADANSKDKKSLYLSANRRKDLRGVPLGPFYFIY